MVYASAGFRQKLYYKSALVQAPTRSIDDVLSVVHVDEEDILNGARRKGEHCAIARPVRRQLMLAGYTPSHVSISPALGHVIVDGKEFWFEHSGGVFVKAFDNGLPVEPCVVNFTRRSDR